MRLLRTACCIALSLLFVAVTLPRPLLAQTPGTWVQIEALPNLARAEDRATAWSTLFPDLAGFRLPSGWYALAIGPYERIEAQQRLDSLRRQGTIPEDSYLAEAARYSEQFWPVAAAAPEAGADEIAVAPLPESEDLGAEAEEEPVAVPEPAELPEALSELLPDETAADARRGEALLSREERQEIQIALRHEGVYASAIDGAFGPGTRAAMASWQAARGYEATGVLTSRQRAKLVGEYRAVLASIGLQEVRDNTAGIAVDLPLALVEKGDYQPPFAHYPSRGGSGVQVFLLSQKGDASSLAGLYETLQTLELVPTSGPRDLRDRGFTIEGRDAEIITHVEARLTAPGLIKGFMLVWPLNDEARRTMVLAAMQESFTPLGESVLSEAAEGPVQELDLVAGLKVRRPEVSRTGLFIDAKGHVLTTADAVGSCGRVTIDGDLPARVLAQDAVLGLALLAPEALLSPLGVAHFAGAEPRLGSEIAVSGYAYDGRLGAPVVTFGRLADLRGLDGSGDVYRLDVTVTPGEAGAPVLDGSGAVTGMLLAPQATGAGGQGARQVLPESVVFAAASAKLSNWLEAQGLAVQTSGAAGDIPPADLTALARNMTVQVSCWQ